MLESVKNKIDNLELIAADFIQTESQVNYLKQKIVELNKSDKLTIKFNFLHVAISKNGGLIALCKRKDYYDLTKSRINDNIIVMHQDATKRYHIPLKWDNKNKYVVDLEFNEKEQLYAFCNDGTIYKIDILTEKAVEKLTSEIIKSEGVEKVKLFEDGFLALTQKGVIYLVEDIKNPDPQFIVSIKDQLEFNNEIDFIGIPAYKSFSGKFEILILNQKGDGVLHIERQEPKDSDSKDTDDNRKNAFQFVSKSNKNKVVKISLFNSPSLEEYKTHSNEMKYQDNNETELTDLNSRLTSNFELNHSRHSSVSNKNGFGKITALALSPSKNYIALYASDTHTVYYLSSKILNKSANEIQKLEYKISADLEPNEAMEQIDILNYKNEQEFLFCGDKCVAVCGGRILMMINNNNETLPIVVDETEHKQIGGYLYCKCISEVDGLRFMNDKEIFLVSKVNEELAQICNPFSVSYMRKLINSYGNFLSKNPFCHDELNEIRDRLPGTIRDLAIAAANMYWAEQDPETRDVKSMQAFLIKAAQFGKSVVQQNEFNFEAFNNICNNIRIINNMRNYPMQPRYITYEEFLAMGADRPMEIISKTIRQLNYKLAYEISKFLGYDLNGIFCKFAIDKIKKLQGDTDPSTENSVYEEIMNTFKNIENISFIEIAKKCIKYHKYDLAEKFLNNEKSILVKIPQYLELGKWNKALELSLKSCDLNVIRVVIDKIYKVEEPISFNNILSHFPQAHSAAINYYKSIGRPEELNKYLTRQNDQEELMFISLENFFKSQNLEEKEKYLKEAKKYLNGAKNLDYSFYKNYLSDLENSMKFKKSCFEDEKKILNRNEITPFDNSIYDCFLKSSSEQYPWIESQNKKFFEISRRKMSVLRFKTLAKENNINEIDEIIKKEGYKKLDISPLKVAYIIYEYKTASNNYEEKAAEYAKQETNQDLYDDKFNFLMSINKYLDAAEGAMSNKKKKIKN